MSSWLDINYAKQISYRLEGWKEKRFSPFLVNFKCPICGDSHKKKSKKRGYLYEHKNSLVYKCFNCNASMSFGHFLKDFDLNLYERYTLDNFKNGQTHQHTRKEKDEFDKFKTVPLTKKYIPSITDDLKSVDELDDNHPAKKYVIERMIPKNMWSKLFYAPKFFKWASGNTDKFDGDSKKDHPRLIIPWYSKEGVVFAYTARSFGDEQPKYYKIVLDETYPLVYGLDRTKEPKYVLEGPIDSVFLPDSIAIGNASLHTYDCNGTYIPDADVRNKDIMKEVQRLIKLGKKVCMLPTGGMWKDLNEAIQLGLTAADLKNIIDKNTYSGLTAELRFTTWSKV